MSYRYHSPLGTFEITCRDSEWNDIARWLDEYFAGHRPVWRPQVSPQGTPFQLRVWQLLLEIPYGETRTYGQLARQLSPRMSAQAVGQALHRNPLPVLVPCHRVVGSRGNLTGYALGLALKQRLLQWECGQLSLPNRPDMEVEICTASLQSVRNAAAGGARRVELCCQLETGGLTPPMEWIDECKRLGLHTRVLIRCRVGDFVYTPKECDQMLSDIAECRRRGADAVVVGFLRADGSIDVEMTRKAVQAARPMGVTFHRAFDECSDPERALEEIIGCGCDKLLTSGQQPSAEQGIPLLKRLVALAHGRISILAGAGIGSDNVQRIIAETGVKEVHGSCKRTVNGLTETDPDEVCRLIAAAQQCS